jgi:hypothetical protein
MSSGGGDPISQISNTVSQGFSDLILVVVCNQLFNLLLTLLWLQLET